MNILKKVSDFLRGVFVFPIRFYQRFISPLFPARCKYYPTCSQYAIIAIKRYGIIIGGALAFWRILRCNPWSKGGIDHVPEKLLNMKEKK